MSTPSNAAHESSLGPQSRSSVIAAMRPMYWSVRRELWENRLLYLAPLSAAAVFLVAYLISILALPGHRMTTVLTLAPAQQRAQIELPYEIVAALIMGTALLVGIFYSLDALYGERRDRSILFWKSLPVSDVTVVLSKLSIPLVVIPLLSFAITMVTQFTMLLLGSAVLLGSGANLASLWAHGAFFRVSIDIFYHMLTVHGLWYAPMYGYLLFISVVAPRAPFILAVLPPFVICVVEGLAFKTSHFAHMLLSRMAGPSAPAATMPGPAPTDLMSTLIPHHFFSQPGLWIGLAVTAVFVAIAVRLRRYRGPI
jgi:ABC-2 type transport system permease protein